MKKLSIPSFASSYLASDDLLKSRISTACQKIAPVWPLESFVAVNPYLGLAGLDFESAAHLLHKAGGIKMSMPLSFYLDALEEGKMSRSEVEEALMQNKAYRHSSFEHFIAQVKQNSKYELHDEDPLLCFAEVASEHSGRAWSRLMVSRISEWASAYYDENQALWQTHSRRISLFSSWRREASLDMTPGIMGFKHFRKTVKQIPEKPIEAVRWALSRLAIPDEGLDLYLHSLLLRLGGWAAYAARTDWESGLYGGSSHELSEFLAVLLCWEACLLCCMEEDASLMQAWGQACQAFADFEPGCPTGIYQQQKMVLQKAFDLAEQGRIIHKLNTARLPAQQPKHQPKVQAVFCIDVRSEVFRRKLEAVSPDIETLGFAGFFAFPIRYVPTSHEQGQAQCPVLLPTGPVVHEKMADDKEQYKAEMSRSLQRQVEHAWRSFKLGAISCFSFVGSIGLAYLPKLLTDSFGWTRPVPHPEKKGLSSRQFRNKDISLEGVPDKGVPGGTPKGITLKDRISMAESALHAMSLTENFARLVLMVGHGSSTVNNPHASGLDCGACGGHTGEANARVAAAVLNDQAVRLALKEKGISIPDSTLFLACQHDTTTDEVSIFNEKRVPGSHHRDVSLLKFQLKEAGRDARIERALRLQIEEKGDVDRNIQTRSRDWAQVRPEWGLAGCSAFVVAPRHHSKNANLQGRSFLHSYEWKKDKDFAVLELIMTAPMVVTSWISLQYYASSVDNLHHGSGNKTLHNVTGSIGVLEGNGGDLRVGLPWQSVHDGEKLQHDPVRLNVCIEAPLEAMNSVLKKHESVRQLCDHSWIHLLAMDDEGQVTHRYLGDFRWQALA
ncbi:MAG: YbcC family protein [Cyclobacteriaceae bacterium]